MVSFKTNVFRSRGIRLFFPIIFACLSACQDTETITVPLRYSVDNIPGADLHISLTVGDSTVNLLVDTGSVGTRILESVIKDYSKINITETTMTYAYGDGVHLAGVLAFGTFGLLPGYFVKNLPFMIIKNVTCGPLKPNCPKKAFSVGSRGGMFGTNLGEINPLPGHNHLPNMLELLPKLSNGFIIHGNPENPSLTLGLTEENTKGFTYINLQQVLLNGTTPYVEWNSVQNGSYSVERNGTTKEVDNLEMFLDSGTTPLGLNDFPFAAINTADNITIRFTDDQNNNITWKFNVGALDELASHANNGHVNKGPTGGILNLGSLAYMANDVLYDRVNGRMGFRPVKNNTATNQTKARSNMKLSLGGG